MSGSCKVFFLLPDNQTPSWGVGMILYLEKFSRDLGIDSCLVLESMHSGFSWISLEVRGLDLQGLRDFVDPQDVLIVPEVMTHLQQVVDIRCRKVVFIQNGFLIPGALGENLSFQSMQFESALVVMKHLEQILTDFWPIETHIVTPVVPNYFFLEKARLKDERKKQVLLFPKNDYQVAGYYDYQIVKNVLQNRTKNTEWKVIDMQGLRHEQVALLMQESAFFVNTNCFESLNASVAEAMAAGCVTFCYEAYGGQDYLSNGVNAYVYTNNYVYPLLQDLLKQMFDPDQSELDEMRIRASETAETFNGSQTMDELENFWIQMEVLSA